MEAEKQVLLDYVRENVGYSRVTRGEKIDVNSPTGIIILSAEPEQQKRYLQALLPFAGKAEWRHREILAALWRALSSRVELDADELVVLLNDFREIAICYGLYYFPARPLATLLEIHIAKHGLSDRVRDAAIQTRTELRRTGFWDDADFLLAVLGDAAPPPLLGGESWANLALNDYDARSSSEQKAWRALWSHFLSAKSSKPAQKWLKTTRERVEAVGEKEFAELAEKLVRAFAASDEAVLGSNPTLLRGLFWATSFVPSLSLAHALGSAIVAANKTVLVPRSSPFNDSSWEDRAPRAPIVGGAGIWALSQWPEEAGVTQLVALKRRIKNRTTLKSLDTAIAEAARLRGIAPADVEELALPDFGLQNGVLTREFGEAKAEIEVSSGKAVWTWTNESGKIVKAAPASVKRDFAGELKELKAQSVELEKTFAAQKDRLDFLLREQKTWLFETWESRYLDHPLMGLLARRVIWNFEVGGQKIAALTRANEFVDAQGATVEVPQNATVSLWHPIFAATDEVLAWRRFFEKSDIKQPFKQAHREIYLLTDAERATRLYSNRFAAHILKQHQFNALCAARGWKNSLRLLVDDTYPPATKEWPAHDLRAEFWIEGIGDDYGVDTNETGTYLRVVTDQVRFYRLNAPENHAHAGGGGYGGAHWRQAPGEPLPIEEIPPLVFSETMRDVDLFVGVASVGADPTWQDGGPNGRFVDYWQNYSFGELGESARTRADVLERLLPRLKIRDVARIEGRFLRVEGKKRAYKIHLGSANILMEPNDQYLCIVPSRDSSENVFLPFEGDRTLAVILSKAFLLASDDKISDPTINRQIES